MWNCVQKWLENPELPFRHFWAGGSDDLTFDIVYPHFFDYLFRVARNMIVIEDMPETFYKPFFMATLIISGKICVFRRRAESGGDLVALNCAQAAEPDLYYVPSKVLVVNPRFKGESYNLKNGEECEVVYCTSQDMYRYGVATGGLYSLIDLTARQLTDNFLSLNVAQKNQRLTTAFAADDENTKESIEIAIRAMYNGAPYKVVQKTLVDNIDQLPLQTPGGNQVLLQLLETHKYILSEFYAAIGIDEPQQMKRERLVSAEVEQGAELPMFNIYDIIESISEGLERVNKMFGTKMTAHINPLIVQALDSAENDGSEETPAGDSTGNGGEPIQPADVLEDITADSDGGGGTPSPAEESKPAEAAEESAEDGTTSAEAAEPETITAAAVDIIETAAAIIDMQEGGGDNGEESSDSGSTGEIRGDSDGGAG